MYSAYACVLALFVLVVQFSLPVFQIFSALEFTKALAEMYPNSLGDLIVAQLPNGYYNWHWSPLPFYYLFLFGKF